MNTRHLGGLLGTLLALLIPIGMAAQSSIRGLVTDSRGKPLGRATVFVEGSFSGGTTDSLGHFSFTHSGNVPFRLIAARQGYQADSLWITKLGQEGYILSLRAERRLAEFVVSGSAIGIGVDKRNAILKPMDVYTNSASAGDLALGLRQLPGLQDVGDREGFFVHGGDASETTVAIEGIVIRNLSLIHI